MSRLQVSVDRTGRNPRCLSSTVITPSKVGGFPQYGYQQFEITLTIATVVLLLVVLVQGIQALGAKLALKASRR